MGKFKITTDEILVYEEVINAVDANDAIRKFFQDRDYGLLNGKAEMDSFMVEDMWTGEIIDAMEKESYDG